MRIASVRRQPAEPVRPTTMCSRRPQPDQPLFTIGQLSHEFGVTLRTLRFYEARGFLSPRRAGTARLYRQCDHDRLALILKTKKLGFTLREIAALIAGEGRHEVLPLSRRQCVSRSTSWNGKRARSNMRSRNCGRPIRATIGATSTRESSTPTDPQASRRYAAPNAAAHFSCARPPIDVIQYRSRSRFPRNRLRRV